MKTSLMKIQSESLSSRPPHAIHFSCCSRSTRTDRKTLLETLVCPILFDRREYVCNLKCYVHVHLLFFFRFFSCESLYSPILLDREECAISLLSHPFHFFLIRFFSIEKNRRLAFPHVNLAFHHPILFDREESSTSLVCLL